MTYHLIDSFGRFSPLLLTQFKLDKCSILLNLYLMAPYGDKIVYLLIKKGLSRIAYAVEFCSQ